MNIKLFFVGMLLISFAPLASAMETISNTVEVTLAGAPNNSDTVVVHLIQQVPTLSAIGLLLLALMLLMAAIVVKKMYKPE